MFNLEQAITDWLEEMFAAGIGAPALDELEIHLREDIEQQMKLGKDARQAFGTSVQRIGQPHALKKEFSEATGIFWLPGGNKPTIMERILSVIWLAGCLWSFIAMCRQFVPVHSPEATANAQLLFMNIIITLIYGAGIIGSLLLFLGADWGRRIIRMFALIFLGVCAVQILSFWMPAGWRLWCGIWAVFSLFSIIILHRPDGAEPNLTPATD